MRPEKYQPPQGFTPEGQAAAELGLLHYGREAIISGLRRENLLLRAELVKSQYEATHDELTGALNRKALEKRLENSEAPPQSMIFADITNLKKVNDEFGHEQGDSVIQVAFGILRYSTRHEKPEEADDVYRYGGDEFLAILNPMSRGGQPVSPTFHVEEVRERIKNDVAEFLDRNPELRSAGLNIAVGSAVLQPGETYYQMRDRADAAMYEMKRQQHEETGDGENS